MSKSSLNVNEVEKGVHQLLFENDMSIWIQNGKGGAKRDKDYYLTRFTLGLIHGPRDGLSFAAQHQRKL